MKFVNLTPHEVVVLNDQGEFRFPSVGSARVSVKSKVVNIINGIEIVSQEYGEIEGLPEPQEGTIYIVSMVVKEAAKKLGRTDVVSPDTSPAGAIRDDSGRIIGVKRFAV